MGEPDCTYYELVADEVHYYVKGFSEETAGVEAGLGMLKFSMSNCLINFREIFSIRKRKKSFEENIINRWI